MPHELEASIDKLGFIPNPESRLVIVRATLLPPRKPTLDWAVPLLRLCVDDKDWLDPTQLRLLMEARVFPARMTKTMSAYVGKIERFGENAFPQLRAPVLLERDLMNAPFSLSTVDDCREFLNQDGRWAKIGGAASRRRMLNSSFDGEVAEAILWQGVERHQARLLQKAS